MERDLGTAVVRACFEGRLTAHTEGSRRVPSAVLELELPSEACPNTVGVSRRERNKGSGAGDGIRTRDILLGKS